MPQDPQFSNATSDRNEARAMQYLLSLGWVSDVQHRGRYDPADFTVLTTHGEELIVEFKKREMPTITRYDRQGGMSISKRKVDRILDMPADGYLWLIEADDGYWTTDLSDHAGEIAINRRKPRAGFNVRGSNDSETGYAYMGSAFWRAHAHGN